MHEWFYDRDVKDPAVILNDKLISDALLNGTGPIKTEHSYSLNSDGDSLPDSPKSLQAKMDGRLYSPLPPHYHSLCSGERCVIIRFTVKLTFFSQLHNDRAKSIVCVIEREMRVRLSINLANGWRLTFSWVKAKTNTVASWWLHCEFRPGTYPYNRRQKKHGQKYKKEKKKKQLNSFCFSPLSR